MSVVARRVTVMLLASLLIVESRSLWAADHRGGREAFDIGSFAEPDPEIYTPPAPRQQKSKLGLVWIDPLDRLPCAFADVGREVASVFDGLGLTLQWHTAAAGAPTDAADLHVILLDDARAGGGATRAMGVTQSNAGSARALWVILPNVRQTLGLAAPSAGPYTTRERWMFARAIARVVAHEIVHTVVPRLPHASSGLMNKRLDRRALLDDGLHLDSHSLRAFLSNIAGDRGQEPALSSPPREEARKPLPGRQQS